MINRFEIQFQGKQVVGEYINRDESSLSNGNFVFFTDDEYGYCKDLKCKQVCWNTFIILNFCTQSTKSTYNISKTEW